MSNFLVHDTVDDLLQRIEPMRAEMLVRRQRGTPLSERDHAALVGAYAAALRHRGWLETVSCDEIARVLEVLVLTEATGRELEIESNITGSVWLVPGWGTTEKDVAAVGRRLAEDEADLLDEAREQGEVTGWE